MDPNRLKVFLEYTNRYSDIAEALPISIRFSGSNQETQFRSDDEKHAAIRYINMCSEQVFLATNGFVDPAIWQHWSLNIAQFFSIESAWKIWEQQHDFYLTNDSFCRFIDECSGGKPNSLNMKLEPDIDAVKNLEVFLAFTNRFDTISKDLPLPLRMSKPILFDGKDIAEIDKQYQLNAILNDPALPSAVLRYLNLCSEEYYFSKEMQGYVSTEVWHHWRQGMAEYMKESLFAIVWDKVADDFLALEPFHEQMTAWARCTLDA